MGFVGVQRGHSENQAKQPTKHIGGHVSGLAVSPCAVGVQCPFLSWFLPGDSEIKVAGSGLVPTCLHTLHDIRGLCHVTRARAELPLSSTFLWCFLRVPA